MAFPTYIEAGSTTSSTSATTVTIGLPTNRQTDDIIILIVETANQTATITNQNGGTWTEIGSLAGAGTAGGTTAAGIQAWWSRYNGTQGNPTIGDAGDHIACRTFLFRGCKTIGDPFTNVADSSEVTGDTSLSATGPTIDSGITDSLVVIVAALMDDAQDFGATWTNSNLSSITVRENFGHATGNDGRYILVTGQKATSGAVGATTNTLTANSAKGMKVFNLIATQTSYADAGTRFKLWSMKDIGTRFRLAQQIYGPANATSFVTIGSETDDSSSSVSLAKPSGILAGDTMYAITYATRASITPSTTNPSGWDTVAEKTDLFGTFHGRRLRISKRVVQESDTGPWSWSTDGTNIKGQIIVYRNVDPNAMPSIVTNSGSTNSATIGLVNVNLPLGRALWVVSDRQFNAGIPSNMTGRDTSGLMQIADASVSPTSFQPNAASISAVDDWQVIAIWIPHGNGFGVQSRFKLTAPVYKDANARFKVVVQSPHRGITVVLDGFDRSVTDGWGSADNNGGPYTLHGTASRYDVDGDAGTINSPADTQNHASLNVVERNAEGVIHLTLPQTGQDDAYGGIIFRGNAGANDYYAAVAYYDAAAVNLVFYYEGFTVAAGPVAPDINQDIQDPFAFILLRAQVFKNGSNTRLRARIWLDIDPEPKIWHIDQDVSSGPQGEGRIGVFSASLVSAFTIAYNDFQVWQLPISDGQVRFRLSLTAYKDANARFKITQGTPAFKDANSRFRLSYEAQTSPIVALTKVNGGDGNSPEIFRMSDGAYVALVQDGFIGLGYTIKSGSNWPGLKHFSFDTGGGSFKATRNGNDIYVATERPATGEVRLYKLAYSGGVITPTSVQVDAGTGLNHLLGIFWDTVNSYIHVWCHTQGPHADRYRMRAFNTSLSAQYNTDDVTVSGESPTSVLAGDGATFFSVTSQEDENTLVGRYVAGAGSYTTATAETAVPDLPDVDSGSYLDAIWDGSNLTIARNGVSGPRLYVIRRTGTNTYEGSWTTVVADGVQGSPISLFKRSSRNELFLMYASEDAQANGELYILVRALSGVWSPSIGVLAQGGTSQGWKGGAFALDDLNETEGFAKYTYRRGLALPFQIREADAAFTFKDANARFKLVWVKDANARFKLTVRAYKDANARFRVNVQAYKDANARFTTTVLAYKDANARYKLWATSYKDANARFRVNVRAYQDANARYKLWVTSYKDVNARFKVTVQAYKDTNSRFKLWATSYKDANARFRVNVQAYKDTNARFKLWVQAYKDANARFRVNVQAYKDASSRFKTVVQGYKDANARFFLQTDAEYKDANARFKINVQAYKDANARFKVTVQAYKDANARFKLWATSYKDANARFRLNVQAYKDTNARFKLVYVKDANARFKLVVREYKDANARFRLNVQAYKDTQARFRVNVLAYKDANARYRLNVQAYKDANARFKVYPQAFKDANVRFKLISASYKDANARFKLWATSYKDTNARFRVNVLAYKDTNARFKTVVRVYKDANSRYNLVVRGYQDSNARFKLWATSYKDANTRVSISGTTHKDANSRFRLGLIAYKDVQARFKVTIRAYKDANARYRLRVQDYKDAQARFRLVVLAYKDANARFKVSVQAYRDVSARFKVTVRAYQDAQARYRLIVQAYKDTQARFKVSVRAYKDTNARYRVTVRAYKDAQAFFKVGILAFKDASTRYRLTVRAYKDASARFVLGTAEVYADAHVRFTVLPAKTHRDASARFRLNVRVYRDAKARFKVRAVSYAEGRVRFVLSPATRGYADAKARVRLSLYALKDVRTRFIVQIQQYYKDAQVRFKIVPGYYANAQTRFQLRIQRGMVFTEDYARFEIKLSDTSKASVELEDVSRGSVSMSDESGG